LFKILGYIPADEKIYLQAFKHKSFDINNNNERLEFLGDAILDFVIAKQLYLENPRQEEGFLSQQRATIVGGKHLNIIGEKMFSESDIKSKLKTIPKNVYGNTLESVIGAIYLDKGIEQAQKFIIQHIYDSEFIKELSDTDYKSKLLKQSQKTKVNIDYRVLKREGPDHKQEFLVALYIGSVKKAEAKGSSIKEAEQKAAKKAYNSVFLT
jgi:ribonuclease III